MNTEQTNSNPSQARRILAWMETGKAITPIEALNEFGCFRLGARIAELKKAGHIIETRMVQRCGKRFASYRLIRG